MEENGTTKGNAGFRVIEGGVADGPAGTGTREGKRPGKVGKAESGLTEKQERFAVLLSQGETQADAYRAAYAAENMKPGVLYSEASKQAKHPKVAERLAELLAEKRAQKLHVSERVGERVWRNVWKLAEGDEVPPAVRATALGLAAKMAGMLTEKVEIKQEADSRTLEQELKQRLAKLGVA